MSENRQKAIIALLIVNAVLVLYFGVSLGKKLTEVRDQVVSQISNVNNMVASLEGRIMSNVQSLLDARDNLVNNVSYTFIDIDAENKKAIVSFAADLKEVKPNSEIFLAYGQEESSDIKELKLDRISGLTYGGDVELDLDKNYQYDLVERVAGGGEALLNTYKQYASLYNDFYQERIQVHESGYVQSRDETGINIGFSVNSFGMAEFELDNAVLEVLYNNEVIDSFDVTNSLIQDSNMDIKQHYNIAIASGEIDVSMSLRDFAEKFGYEQFGYEEQSRDGRDRYVLSHTIRYSDYGLENTEPEYNSSEYRERFRMNLIITCNDGYTYRVPGLG